MVENMIEKASDYQAAPGEANFGEPIEPQIVGGTHIAAEFITKQGEVYYVIEWPQGLPGHSDPPDTVRFPHGLMKFGESLQETAQRIVGEQLGMKVVETTILSMDSYVDDHNHWHIEPNCLSEVSGEPDIHEAASKSITFPLDDMPDLTYWPEERLKRTIKENMPGIS